MVTPTTDDPNRWVAHAVMTTDESPARSLEVSTVRSHHDNLLVRFDGIDDRNAAEGLRGVTFHVPARERRLLGEGEFWPDQLIECTVVDLAGEELGTVVGIEFGVAQDRLAVRTERGEVVVPFVSEIVPSVDLEAGKITVVPPEGLF